MTKIVVTGGAGFIGSHIVDRCIAEGYQTVVIDNLSTGKINNVNPGAVFYKADIRTDKIHDIFEKERPDIVIHHAAQIDVQKSIHNPFEDAGINISGTVNLLKAAVGSGVRKFIYASSAAVYGSPEFLPVTEQHAKVPISFYGVSKYVPEYYIQTFAGLYDLEYVILRYANVYGIRQDPKGEGGVISIFLDRMLKGESITVFGDGSQTRDFIYVGDVAEANLKAVRYGRNAVCNIGTGENVSLNELIGIFEDVGQREQNVLYGNTRKGDIIHSCLANTEALEKLQWQPQTTLREGLTRTFAYYSELAEREQPLVREQVAAAR
jgi:UDP-glucose 4-epimerase